MRLFASAAALAATLTLVPAPEARAQQPTPADSAARADSLERARQDSITLVRELERIRSEPRNRVPAATPGPAQGGAQGGNPRMLPDISALGDLVGDLSPDGSTLEEGQRFGVREIELAVQANVDPYFRADFIIGVHPDAVEIEEAYATTTSLPWGLQLRLGRVHLPFGKQNVIHRPELHSIEYPHVVQRFLGDEGRKGDGIFASRVFAPLGFYQELQLGVMDRLGGEEHGHAEEEGGVEAEAEAAEPANRRLSGLGYIGRFRNYWDLSEAANLELSASAATGRSAQPFDGEIEEGVNAVNARQSLVGLDVTYRWRPLQQGLYRSLIVQAEWMRQLNEDVADRGDPLGGPDLLYDGPRGDFDGAYLFARWQTSRRTFVGARYDWLQDDEADGDTFGAVSGYLTWFPSEFAKLVAGFERVMPAAGGDAVNRILLQATFSVGPHRPHPF
jgi:hypothetical protein